MPTPSEKLAKIAETSAAQTAAMQQLFADMRAAEAALLAADTSADPDETALAT